MSDHQEAVSVPRDQFELMQRSMGLLDKMLGDPTIAPDAEKLIQKANPHAVFPQRASREALLAPAKEMVDQVRAETKAEIEAANAKAAALQEKWDAREARELAAAQRAEEASLTTRLKDIQNKRGFSEETMAKVLDRMRENNNPDVDSAAAWVSEQIPKPLPSSGYDYLPSTVDVGGGITDEANKAWDGLRQDSSRWQTDELRKIVKDPEFLRLGNV